VFEVRINVQLLKLMPETGFLWIKINFQSKLFYVIILSRIYLIIEILLTIMSVPIDRDKRASRTSLKEWIPAFAGMTKTTIEDKSNSEIGSNHPEIWNLELPLI